METDKLFLRRLLQSRSEWVEQRLNANAARNGYGDVTPAMSRLLANLLGRPLGLSELARRLAVSRQAVHKLANEAAQLGYVEFVDSEADARIKLLRFTEKGWDMAESAEQQLDAIEAEIEARIGPERMAQLKQILAMPWSADEAEKLPRTRASAARQRGAEAD